MCYHNTGELDRGKRTETQGGELKLRETANHRRQLLFLCWGHWQDNLLKQAGLSLTTANS